jgi:AcrR family transcriptional regulator
VKEIIRRKVVETKRNIILEEVSEVFESEGFTAVKMQEIARRLGMSVGALYKLFDSKEALYYAYVEFQIRRFHEALLQACPSTEEPRICLTRYIRMKFDVFRAKRKAIEDPVMGDPLFFFKMNTHHNEPARPIFEFLAALFERLAEREPLREEDPLKVAYLFNAFTTGYVEYWIHYDRGLEGPEERVLDEFLEGMKR